MIKFLWYKSIKRIAIFAFVVTVVLMFSACAKKIAFQNSTVVPAARGYIKVKKDNNKNYVISVSLLYLAEPSRLQPPKQVYVVWLATNDNINKNVGQIITSTSLLSKTLKGSFETVSSSKPTKVFITAEDDANTQYSGTQVVLTTDSF